MIDVIYEDNHVIVVYKPKGILSQSDGSPTADIDSMVKEYLVNKYNKPGSAYLGLLHRLDRNTQGLMVFAKSSKAAARISNDIQNHKFYKTYYALVDGFFEVGKKEEIYSKLQKNEKENKSYIEKNGKDAKLIYEVLDNINIKNQHYSLVKVKLLTGRHHQIRVQLASIGMPLSGDKKYNENPQSSLYFLEAYRLEFYHPITHELLCFEKSEFNNIN